MRSDLYQDMYKTEEMHWWHVAKRLFVKNLITTHIPKKTLSILDVGCGTGKNMEELSYFGDVWGVDISSDALAFCKKRGLIQVKKGEAEKLPFENESFDVATILDVLEHVDDIAALSEIKRVLKDDGYIIITVPAFNWLWSKWDEVLHHKRRYTRKQIDTIVAGCGFNIIRNTHIHSFLIIPSLVIRKLKQLQKKQYTSDFQINNPYINTFFAFISRLEQMWITRYDMPVGTSILCLAQKKTKKFRSPL